MFIFVEMTPCYMNREETFKNDCQSISLVSLINLPVYDQEKNIFKKKVTEAKRNLMLYLINL